VPALIPLVAGFVALAAGVLILQTFGPRYRVGRLLASTPEVSVAEARALAATGRPRYVKVRGRIDAEDEFEDDAHRPLVFRRTRLQVRRNGWVSFEDGRERVPFEIREGLEAIAVDDAALDVGLVVIPRESVGTAADVIDRVPPGTAPEAPVRLLIEQVSSVEQATVVGVPAVDDAGAPHLTAGLGRPLVLTTLEASEAMRVLTGGDRRRPLVAVAFLASGVVLIALGLLAAIVGALA